MDKNKLIAELLGMGFYIYYTSDAGKIAILSAIKRTGDLEDFLILIGRSLFTMILPPLIIFLTIRVN